MSRTKPLHKTPLILIAALATLLPSVGCDDLFALGCTPRTLPDTPTQLGADVGRPTPVYLPDDYDPSRQYPLVISLHGYILSGEFENGRFGFSEFTTEYGFIAVIPTGRKDSRGLRYWAATDACCGDDDNDDTDEDYLRGLIIEAGERFSVDPNRVYITGTSNGGFMSHRMACRSSDLVTAVVSLAGVTFLDEADCTPERPVSVLQIHGTLDYVVPYLGLPGRQPGARTSLRRAAANAGCDLDAARSLSRIDFARTVLGRETTRVRYEAGCAEGADAELWTVHGGVHLPLVDEDEITRRLLEWLLSHSR